MQQKMREFSILKKRILQYLDYKGISKYEFYQLTGVSNGVLSQKNGFSEENTLRILSVFGELSPEWLITGEGDMLKGLSNITQKQPPTQPPAHPDQPQNSICKLCQEKDERILDLKSSILDLKENINNLKEINTGLNGILQSQQFVIQSLQDHIEDLQQPHFDAEDSTPSRTG
jgi:hypothetical protein